MNVAGKTVVITGASRGIGAEAARVFAAAGANVVLIARSSEAIEKIAAEIGNQAIAITCDVANYASVERSITKAKDTFGDVDILINNAGITRDNLLMRMSESQWDEIMEINLKSCFNTVKAAFRPLMKQRSGSIINMSSVVGIKGNMGQANYAASKAGIIGFSKSVALELGSRGIRCNVVAPGFIETEMTSGLDEKVVQTWRDAIPLKRGGSPEDVANACVFLASDSSTYITGQVLQVNGGLLT